MGKKRFSPNLDSQVVPEALSREKTPSQIAKQDGIHPNSTRLWKKEFLERRAEWVVHLADSPAEFTAALEHARAEARERATPNAERLAAVEAEVSKDEGKLERLVDIYLAGTPPKEKLAEREATIRAHLDGLLAEHERLRGEMGTVADEFDPDEFWAGWSSLFDDLRGVLRFDDWLARPGNRGKSRSDAWAEYWGASYDPQISSLGDVLAGLYRDLDVQVVTAVEAGEKVARASCRLTGGPQPLALDRKSFPLRGQASSHGSLQA